MVRPREVRGIVHQAVAGMGLGVAASPHMGPAGQYLSSAVDCHGGTWREHISSDGKSPAYLQSSGQSAHEVNTHSFVNAPPQTNKNSTNKEEGACLP